ncbi:diaminobutyrate acetyltransferase [Geobacillus sp. MMMUD3]|nr:diaminobutyrate acetyltransferase [Geobacillus sp. MMMUD3]
MVGVRNALAQPKTETDVRTPSLEDGQHLWRLAKDSAVLDLNSSYSYLLWCRDFADTSAIAWIENEPAGFVTGYTRPESPDTLMIWQVAVSERFRGRGLASTMLHALADRTGALRLETTITDDNAASYLLFQAFAEQRGAGFDRRPLFTPDLYPDGHDTEYLYEIAPL